MFGGETEADAINRAVLFVENIMQRPDQLQKVEQHKRRVQRKKLSVDAMLKTAMQSQLDGVRTGLSQLHNALMDLKEIKSGLSDIEGSLQAVPALNKVLQACREEYLKHSQFAAAVENLKHIFTVPDSIEKTRQYIADGKLLNAHQCIMDLENSRDDLLYELHKLPNQNPNETRMLKECFAELQPLSDELGKQLWIILQRTLNTVRKEPTQIVTALRIIEREERADQYALTRQKASGFLPPGRPKELRKKSFDVLEKVVSQRIEGNQFEDRNTNKNWLIRHLEVIRMMLLEDFKVIKSQCVPCFPPNYDIVNSYLGIYHRTLSSHLVELVEGGLLDNEIVTLLSWSINSYKGKDLMGSPALALDVSKLGDLLDETLVRDLQQQYIGFVKSNYARWMEKALVLEEREWVRPEPPHQDSEGRYKTELTNLLHDMVRQNLEVAGTINSEVQASVLITSLEQIRVFANKYEKGIANYKNDYFLDRSKIQYFTCYMIALGNSSQGIMEMMSAIKQQYWRPGNFTHIDRQVATNFEGLTNTYQRLRDTVCDFLMEEALIDLNDQFGSLVTPKWVSDPEPMDTICLTLSDYFQDYTHLHPKILEHILELALNTVGVRYLTSVMQKRLSLKTDEERRKAAERMVQDAEKLQAVFQNIAPEISKFDSPCEAIKMVAEVVMASDMELLSLEVHRLLRRYPDINSDHLTSLLLLRGDIGRFEVRQRVSEYLEEVKSQRSERPGAPPPNTIFSHVQVQSFLFS